MSNLRRFNICLVQPAGYVHSGAFTELAELLLYSLTEIGCDVSHGTNRIERSARNILIGVHLLDGRHIDDVPKDSIIINTEQLSSVYSDWNANVLKWFAAGFEVWDYSDRNIEYLKAFGMPGVKKLGIGFQKELVRVSRNDHFEVDVLFYGSINERRRTVLNKLHDAGVRVQTLFGAYGKVRDEWIGRSRLVLNHHFYDSQIFEVVRVFYLLTNSVAVVGEVNSTTLIEERFKCGIVSAPYEALVDATLSLLNNDQQLTELREKAFNCISRYPQTGFMKELI